DIGERGALRDQKKPPSVPGVQFAQFNKRRTAAGLLHQDPLTLYPSDNEVASVRQRGQGRQRRLRLTGKRPRQPSRPGPGLTRRTHEIVRREGSLHYREAVANLFGIGRNAVESQQKDEPGKTTIDLALRFKLGTAHSHIPPGRALYSIDNDGW